MGLLELCVLVIIIGVVLNFIPADARTKQIVIGLLCIFVLIWLLGGIGGGGHLRLH